MLFAADNFHSKGSHLEGKHFTGDVIIIVIVFIIGRCIVYKQQLRDDNFPYTSDKRSGNKADRPLEDNTQAGGKKMKPSSYDEDVRMLTKNSAKTLLVRNAMNQAKLTKEARQLEKERHSEEMLFLKKREHLIKQQTARNLEIGQRPWSSCNPLQQESAVTRWKSDTSLAGGLSPKSRIKNMVRDHKKQTPVLSSSFPLLSSEGTAQQSSPQSRRRALTILSWSHTASSLPDIHAATNGTTGRKKNTDTNKTSNLSYKETSEASLDSETDIAKEWKELERCRYLRRKES